MNTTVNSIASMHEDIKVIFDDYSEAYDLFLEISEPYQELLQKFKESLLSLEIDRKSSISVLDIGGGTGNFSAVILSIFSNAYIQFLEPNASMAKRAFAKIGKEKIIHIQESFDHFIPEIKYDLIICIHALYLMPDPKLQIPRIANLLKDDSFFIICDIGKKIKVWEWSIYFFKNLLPKHGWTKTVEYFKIGKSITAANKKINSLQKNGNIWTHSLHDFTSYLAPFFEIKEAFVTYRGCSRFVVGSRKAFV